MSTRDYKKSALSTFSSCFERLEGSKKINIAEPFFNDLQDCISGKLKTVLLCGGDKYISDNFIHEVETHQGTFYWFDCREGNYKITPNQNGLEFSNVHKLSKSKLSEFLSELLTGEYKDKCVILQSKDSLPKFSCQNLKKINVPNLREVEGVLDRIFLYMLIKHNISLPKDKMIDNSFAEVQHRNVMIDALKLIPSLYELDKIVQDFEYKHPSNSNLSSLDFWNDVKVLIQNRPINNDVLLIKTKLPKIDRKIVKINHIKGTGEWTVDVENSSTHLRVPYTDSLAIMYIVYLVKYCEFPNSINVDKLWTVVHSWQTEAKKEIKVLEDSRKNISGAKKSSGKKKPSYKSVYELVFGYCRKNNLSFLTERNYGFIKITKTVCYYHPQDMVTVIVPKSIKPGADDSIESLSHTE